MNPILIALALAQPATAETDCRCKLIEFKEIENAGLPAEIKVLRGGVTTVDDHNVLSNSLADGVKMENWVFDTLEKAEGNEEQARRARRRRNIGAITALGGLGVELGGGAFAIAAGAPLALTVGLPITLGGAAVGLVGVAIATRNRPLREAADGYNEWAAAHPDQVGLELDGQAEPSP